MRILVHAPMPNDGTSFYRALGPFSHLQKKYPDIEVINGSGPGTEYSWSTLLNIDIVFLQRPSMPDSLEIIKVAKLNKKIVWIDYDDDYINIPVTNPRHDLYNNPARQAKIKACMTQADIITVSTPEIEKSIRENYNLECSIYVVPNAFDPNIFYSTPGTHHHNKVILWRGGDTHVKDVEIYKDAIVTCFDKYPEYTWVFYGHNFPWMTEHALAMGQPGRVKNYEFKDLMQYFNNLMEILPEIMIVPLEDNIFNRGKSNISWIEGTLAGATVMATALPEFGNSAGCVMFHDEKSFIDSFSALASSEKLRESQYLESIVNIPSLDEVNKMRLGISQMVMHRHKEKLSPKKISHVEQWDDKRFFEYCLANGHIQENTAYMEGHHAVADWLIKKLNPETMVEIGCGPGAMLERFIVNNVQATGIELNDHMIEYFQSRNPNFADFIQKVNITQDGLDFDLTDLGISIEVFEHIDMPEEWWDEFIKKLGKKFKHFYFSSTPYNANPTFDKQWGHINVRQDIGWINLFERNGWKLIERPQQICQWDMLFKSEIVGM